MSKLKEIRMRLGLTQEVMAIMLDVSRGQYAMVESGRRTCPDLWYDTLDSVIRFFELYQSDEFIDFRPESFSNKEDVINHIKKIIEESEFELRSNEYQLIRMKTDFPKLELVLALIENEMSTFYFNERIVNPLKKKRISILKKLDASSPERQKLIALRIRILKMIIPEYKAVLIEMSGLDH